MIVLAKTGNVVLEVDSPHSTTGLLCLHLLHRVLYARKSQPKVTQTSWKVVSNERTLKDAHRFTATPSPPRESHAL